MNNKTLDPLEKEIKTFLDKQKKQRAEFLSQKLEEEIIQLKKYFKDEQLCRDMACDSINMILIRLKEFRQEKII